MHDDIHEVNNYPLHGSIALVVVDRLAAFLTHRLPNMFCDGSDLRSGPPLADHEKVGYCLRDFPQIHGNQMLSFLVQNGLDDDLQNLAAPVQTCHAFRCCIGDDRCGYQCGEVC